MNNKLNAISAAVCSVMKGSAQAEEAHATGRYFVQCIAADGTVRWEDEIENLVTTVGKNDALDKYLSGSAYTAAWYIGLIGSTSYTSGVVAGDTAASHGGWVEATGYSQASRPTAAFSSASAGTKSLSAALSFSINADTTIKGSFLMSVATKGGTTGMLYSAGLFTGGDKVVQNGDTLNVSYSASL